MNAQIERLTETLPAVIMLLVVLAPAAVFVSSAIAFVR